MEQPRYRPLRVADVHVIGPDGRPDYQITTMTIVAETSSVDRLRYRIGTSCLSVVGLQGCEAGPLRQVDSAAWEVEVRLPSVLHTNEKATVVYQTCFSYPAPPSPVFRRFTGWAGYEALDLTVVFQGMTPVQTFAAEWESPQDGAKVVPESRQLLSLQRIEDYDGLGATWSGTDVPRRKVIGLYWDWK